MTEFDWGDMAGAGFQGFKISNRDQALFLIDQLDLDWQLVAIKGMLCQNREAEAQVAKNIKALDTQIRNCADGDEEYQMHLENHWLDTVHETVFQGAAHSMSAVGMLAPFIESLIVSVFQGLRERLQANKISVNESIRGLSSTAKFWDPRWVCDDKKWQKLGLVHGTTQLADALGLSSFLPDGFKPMHAALTAYRNRMFHNGFEWPLDKRKKFGELIKTEGWPREWFSRSTSDDDPWVFYMSDDFIEHCLQMIDHVLEGVGRYLSEDETGQI